MDDKTASLISLMAATLSEMTERALKAEKEREELREDARSWYKLYHEKEIQCKEKEDKLEALREYIEALEDKKRSAVKEAEQRRKNSIGAHKNTTEAKNTAETPQTSADEQGGQANA